MAELQCTAHWLQLRADQLSLREQRGPHPSSAKQGEAHYTGLPKGRFPVLFHREGFSGHSLVFFLHTGHHPKVPFSDAQHGTTYVGYTSILSDPSHTAPGLRVKCEDQRLMEEGDEI